MNAPWKQRTLTAALSALAVAAVLGCGGGSESNSDTATAPLTKAEFLKKGNQICKKRLKEKDEAVKAAFERLPPSESTSPSQESLEEIGNGALQPIQRLTDELSELSAPVSDETAARHITRELEADLQQAKGDLSHLIHTDPFKKAGEAAKAYGFKACTF